MRLNSAKNAHFIIDTGAGLNVISEELAEELGCKLCGNFTAQRMTGEEMTVKITEVASIELGCCSQKNVETGVTDLFSKLPDSLGKIDGALSLNYFKQQPFSIDYSRSLIVLEGNEGMAARVEEGITVPIEHHCQDNKTTDAFVNVTFDNTHIRLAEIDTGNTISILDVEDMKKLSINPESENVQVIQSANETGKHFTRYYTHLDRLSLTKDGKISVRSPKVCFEEIIYGAVIGNDFLKNFIVTFDLLNKRLVFNLPETGLKN